MCYFHPLSADMPCPSSRGRAAATLHFDRLMWSTTHWSYIINDTCQLSPSSFVTRKKTAYRLFATVPTFMITAAELFVYGTQSLSTFHLTTQPACPSFYMLSLSQLSARRCAVLFASPFISPNLCLALASFSLSKNCSLAIDLTTLMYSSIESIRFAMA